VRGGSRQSICQPALHLSQRSSLSQTASDGKKTNAPITPIRPLPGDSAPLGVINTAASRGGNESHSRGEGDPVHKDKSPLKKKNLKEKSSGSRSRVPPMANHGTNLGLNQIEQSLTKMKHSSKDHPSS